MEQYSSGRRGPPAKGVGRIKPARGFESLLLRCVVTQTTDYFSHYPAKVEVVQVKGGTVTRHMCQIINLFDKLGRSNIL